MRPGELAYVYSGSGGRTDLQRFQELSAGAMSSVTSHVRELAVLGEAEGARRIGGDIVAPNYFQVLGVPMLFGPGLAHGYREQERTVVLSHAWWRQKHQSDPEIIGRTTQLNGVPFRISGVAPEGFGGLAEAWNPASFWSTPASYYPGVDARADGYLVGRLRSGVSLRQARLLEQPAKAEGRQATAPEFRMYAARDVITPFEPENTSQLRVIGSTAMIITAGLLMLAAINIAGTILVRGAARTRELAVRRALGASGFVLARGLLVEGLILATIGGGAGLALAAGLIRFYEKVSPDPFRVYVSLDLSTISFLAALSLLVGMVIGMAPAVQARNVDVLRLLGGGGSAGASLMTRRRLRFGVLLPQLILSIALLVIAAVHLRALARAELTNLGYRVSDIAVVKFSYGNPSEGRTSQEQAEHARKLFRRALQYGREANPSGHVALVSLLPTNLRSSPLTFAAKDAPTIDDSTVAKGSLGYLSDGALETLGIALLRGRDFDETDTPASRRVTIVSHAMATQLWGHLDPIGRSLGLWSRQDRSRVEWLEVVGVSADIRPAIPDGRSRPFVYRPVGQISRSGYPLEMVARGPHQPAKLTHDLTAAVAASDPTVEVWSAGSLEQILEEVLYFHRAAGWTLGLCGLAGLLVATVGVYGAVAQTVAQQEREFSIRAALGATPVRILWKSARDAASLVGLALVPAILFAAYVLRALAGSVASLPAFDLVAFIAAPAVMALVVLAAGCLPAQRAARQSPVAALRHS